MTERPAPDLKLDQILHALGDVTRLSTVRQLATQGPLACGQIKSKLTAPSMTRHFRILREAGVVDVKSAGTSRILSLRTESLNARYPGLLDAITGTE